MSLQASKEGETMNDLFTILIILAFIISFLNKIFGKKKEQQTTQRQPIPRQKQPEWLPPWLQQDEAEVQLPSEREEELDIIEEIEHKQTSIEKLKQPKATPPQPIITEINLFQEESVATVRPEVKPLKALGIELSSRNELKRGIVLAEILGPCRARRKLKR
jgi:DNA segregation ATPase FtsK/SpoIIIE-like protein